MQDFEDVQMRELVHRMRNLLTTTRAVVSQTLRNATSIEEARRVVDDRLNSLGGAIDLLMTNNWQPSSLDVVLRRSLAPFGELTQRVTISGPQVVVGPHASVTLNLAIHELTTNAIKYGALSREPGHVELTSGILSKGGGEELWIQWAEQNGPEVILPERQGFGTRLICSAVSHGLRGQANLRFPPSGVIWTLAAPLAALAV